MYLNPHFKTRDQFISKLPWNNYSFAYYNVFTLSLNDILSCSKSLNFNSLSNNLCLYSPSTKLLDVIAIDHLPSLLPKDSSDKYAAKLLPFLLKLPEVCQWINKGNCLQSVGYRLKKYPSETMIFISAICNCGTD